ncbi:hypothetical protein [Neptuniibacter halophilus]|uniref:hypothetical protein n=1 Tax=Neptuniibacter halophilus TaxID=651666 RepID=UPI00257473BA|nr:hypothetical protein [Neptuniibacter halophilus]
MNDMNPQQGQPQADGGLLSLAEDLNPGQVEMMKKGFQIAQQIMYDEQVFGSMMQEAMQGGEPAEALGNMVVQVVMKLQEHFGKVDFVVLLALGIKVIDDLADAINQTGRLQIEEQDIQQAMSLAVQMWLTANQGSYDPAEVQSLAGQAKQGGL